MPVGLAVRRGSIRKVGIRVSSSSSEGDDTGSGNDNGDSEENDDDSDVPSDSAEEHVGLARDVEDSDESSDGEEDDDDDSNEGSSNENEGEDDDESDSPEEVELPLVENPAEDIRGELNVALKHLHNTAGSFFSLQSFSSGGAHDPKITIEGFGTLDLPLTKTTAKKLAASEVSKQAPFGKGERTIVDKTVRDTWEVDGSKLKFGNTAWNGWMKSIIVPQVCRDLGVNVSTSTPRADLYKLLLYEKGSHFLPHQDTEKAPGMFATIVVVLPSKFSGGSLHLTHAGKTKTIDVAESSATMTHALAWYTDVFHSVHPVESGYRLALSYNLIHTKSQKLKPRPQTSAKTGRLKNILLSWKQAKEGRLELECKVPDQLLYTLDHKYSKANLLAEALKGKDADLVAGLKDVVKELNFGLYIANIALLRTGRADDSGPGWEFEYGEPEDCEDGSECDQSEGCQCGSDRGYGDDSDEEGNRHHHHNDRDRCDYDSKKLDVKFDEIYEEKLSVTNIVDLDGKLLSSSGISIKMSQVIPEAFGKSGKPDKKEYEGYQGNYGGDLDHWYHRTVLIFCPDKDVFGKGNIPKYICKVLEKSQTSEPRPKERRLANRLITDFEVGKVPTDLTAPVVTALTEAATRWKNVDIWTRAACVCPPGSLLQSTGVQGILDAYQAFDFVSLEPHLTAALSEDQSNARRIGVIREMTRLGLDNKDQTLLDWTSSQYELASKTLRKGAEQDIDFLIIIAKEQDVRVLSESIFPQLSNTKSDVSFWMVFLHKLIERQDEIPSNPGEVEAVVIDQVSRIVSNAPPFSILEGRYSSARELTPTLEEWIFYIKFCVSLECHDACSLHIQKMIASYNEGSKELMEMIADNILVPAIAKLDEEAGTYGPNADSWLKKFFVFALDAYMRRTVIEKRGKFVPSQLMIIANRSGGATPLKTKLDPIYDQLAKNRLSDSIELILLFVEAKNRISKGHPDRHAYREIIDKLLKSLIANADLEAPYYGHTPQPRGYTYKNIHPESKALMLIKLCHLTKYDTRIPSILNRVLNLKLKYCDEITHIENGIVPLISQLKAYLTSKGCSIADEPYTKFVALAIGRYMKTILGERPTATKNNASGVAANWARKQEAALQFLRVIGSEATLRKILGSYYEKIMSLVERRRDVAVSSSSSSVQHGGPYRSATKRTRDREDQSPNARPRKHR